MQLDVIINSIDLTLVRTVVMWVLSTIGYWKLFEKCEVKGHWAAIPLAREYHLSL